MKKMKDILKRKVSVGLVTVMLVSQTPVPAFASEMPEFKTEQTLKTENLISEPTEDEPAEAEEILLEDAAGALSAQEVPSDENPEPGEDTESEVVENEESTGEDGYTEVSTWNKLQEQLNAGGNVTLTNDVTAGAGDSALMIPSYANVTLDLNGHTIDRGLAGQDYVEGGNVITVNGNLTLTDSSTGKTGKLTGGNTSVHGGGVYVMTNGRFTMEGGTISGCSAGSGGGVFVEGGEFRMNGGTISDCSANCGGGVAANISSFTMEDGTISGCNAYMQGGGVYVKVDSEFTMTGGTISGCSSDSGVGGVYVDQSSTFTISGTPVIRGNKKDVSANNVVLDGGKTTITVTSELTTGAEIWVNADKGVAFAKKEGSYNITDTDLAKFHSDTDSSLVAAEDSDGSVKFFTPWEALQVKFNNASTVAGSPTRITLTGSVTADTGDSPLLIPEGKHVTLDLNGHTIDRGLAVQPAVGYGNVITVKGNLTLDDSSDNENTPEYDGTGKLTGGNNNGYGGGVDVSRGTFTMNGGTISGCSADNYGGVYVDNGIFTMNNGMIKDCRAENGVGGGVGVYGTFTMNGGTIDCCKAASGGGVYVSSGTFNMNGGTISACTALSPANPPSGATCWIEGGGVFVYGGTFNMQGGIISACTALSPANPPSDVTYRIFGGGVYVYDSATFNISGTPVIRDNKKDVSANNVVLDGGKTITVTGELTTGAEIWVNAGKDVAFATKGDSYSITDTDLAKFHSDTVSSLVAAEDSDGSVKFFTPWGALQAKFNNASTVAGSPTRITLTGSVTASGNETALVIPEDRYVTLDLNGNTIDRGLASQPVGNNDNVITVSGNLTLTDSSSAHTGTIIGGNNAQASGGGVYVKGGTFTMDGGTISGCNAARGSGVNVDSGTFTMTGGTITGCKAYDHGGGVCVDSGTFTMTGGTITDCNAIPLGGGVYVDSGTFTMTGGTITGCKANNSGGGVYNHGTFNMSGGTITNCSATGDESNGGGVYIEDRGTFKVSGTPVISGNKISGTNSPNNVELNGKTISINGALTSGAEIHVNAGLGVPIAEKGGDRTTALTETEAGYFKSDVDSNLLGGLNADGQVVLKDPLPALTSPADLTYNGTEQTPELTFSGDPAPALTEGTDYTVSYKKVDGSTGTALIGAPKDAGDYKAVAAGKGNYAGTSEAVFTIAPKTVTVSSGISANDKTYDGTAAAALDTTGAVFDEIYDGDSLTVSGNGTFEDASAGTNKTVTIDQSSLTLGGTSSGNYVLAGSGNQQTATANITKATPEITQFPTASAITYGKTLSDSNLTNGAAKLGETDVPGSFAWSDNTIAPAVSDSNKTEYTVTFTPNDTTNLNQTTCKVKLTVNKAAITADQLTAPAKVEDLKYTGQAQALITAGSCAYGTTQYALGTETAATAPYTTTIPKATNAGTYYVWYKVVGDANHNDYVSESPVSVTIAKVAYTGTKEVSVSVRSGQATSNKTVALPSLPEGASYDAVTVSGNSALISGIPTVDGTTLTFSTTAQDDLTSATITIRVTDATNYNDYDVVVTVTAKAKDEAGVVIAQGATLNKAYGDADLTLNATVSKAGEGTGTWTWTSTAPDVLSVTGSGSSATVHILKPGTATVKAEYESDTTMGEASIQINIAKGEKPANAPTVLNVKYEVTAISSCGLPDGWVWNTSDPNYSKTIPEGGSLAVTADYSAADRIYYNTTRVSVTIYRADGGKKDDTETIKDDIGNKAAPKGIWIANLESSYTYTGRNITPEVHVYAEDLLLTRGLDYTVSYKNNKNANDASVASKAPTVTVKLKGSYSGTKSATFRIAKLDLSTAIAQDIYKPVAKKAYGTIKPALYIDGTELKLAGSEAAYENPTGDYYSKPGTYDITVKAKNTAKNVTGTRKVKLHIVDAPTMEKVKAKASKSSYKYGDIKGITDPKEAVPVKVTYNNAVITEGFKVIYESGTSWKTLGTHYITVKGDGKTYYGEKKISYKVTGKYSLDDDNAWIYIDGKKCDAGSDNISVSYNKTGIKPAVSIRYKPDFGSDQFVLTERQDFTVSYRNNRNAGDTAEVTIKGKGIYSGKLTRKFTVSKVDLNDLILFVSDRAESKTKDDFKKTTKILYDKNLVDQKAPLKDFDIKYTDKDGKEISGTPAKGTLVNVTVTAKDTCKNFTGTKSTGFHIIDKTRDVGKMKVSFTYDKNAKGKSVGYYFFTGSEIRPQAVSQLHVKSGQTELKASDYSVRYFNNVNKGNKAAVLITGNDTAGYFGVKTAYFKIGNAAPLVFDKSSGTFK